MDKRHTLWEALRYFKGKSCHYRRQSQVGEVWKLLTLARWHQDIKPGNILVSGDLEKRPYAVRFMLADLGLSHFTAVVAHEDEMTSEDTGGSRAYSMTVVLAGFP